MVEAASNCTVGMSRLGRLVQRERSLCVALVKPALPQENGNALRDHDGEAGLESAWLAGLAEVVAAVWTTGGLAELHRA